ncbi:MAG: hypothetical protein JST46_17700 [Bacteroidetes bacterium]|nr:hypothetical protein [Bacteroidota bacterium]
MRLIIFAIILSYQSFAQHLTFDDFHNLYKEDLEKCDLLLTTRGFVFNKSIKEDNGTMTTLWLFKRGTDLQKSNEYFTKNCYGNKCDVVSYFISDSNHFNSLREMATKKGAKYLSTDSDPEKGLSFYYLFIGPTELKFQSLPSTTYNSVKVFAITLREMKVNRK